MTTRILKAFGGLEYVTIKNVPVRKSKKYGDILDCDMGKLEKNVAKELIKRKIPLRGAEVKYLRKVNGLSMGKLGAILGLSSTAIMKWEKRDEERLSPINEVALRVFFSELMKVGGKIKFSDLGPLSEPEKIEYKVA